MSSTEHASVGIQVRLKVEAHRERQGDDAQWVCLKGQVRESWRG